MRAGVGLPETDHVVYTEGFMNVAPIVPLSFHLVVLVGFQALELVFLWGTHAMLPYSSSSDLQNVVPWCLWFHNPAFLGKDSDTCCFPKEEGALPSPARQEAGWKRGASVQGDSR